MIAYIFYHLRCGEKIMALTLSCIKIIKIIKDLNDTLT